MAEPSDDHKFGFSPTDVFARRKRYWANGYRPLEVWGPTEKVDDRGQPLKNPGKQPRGAGWQQRAGRDPPEAAVSAPHQRALNTGVLCGLVVAPDIDVPLQELADRIVHLFEERCGFTPLARIGKAPKILLCYQAERRSAKSKRLNSTYPMAR
jgi:putative DNA primase/helicase